MMAFLLEEIKNNIPRCDLQPLYLPQSVNNHFPPQYGSLSYNGRAMYCPNERARPILKADFLPQASVPWTNSQVCVSCVSILNHKWVNHTLIETRSKNICTFKVEVVERCRSVLHQPGLTIVTTGLRFSDEGDGNRAARERVKKRLSTERKRSSVNAKSKWKLVEQLLRFV